MYQLQFTPEASADIERIFIYTADTWGYEQAKQYDRKLERALLDIAEGITQGKSGKLVRAEYCKHLVGSHVIYFRYIDTAIKVIRILHQQMDVNQHL